ncbi:MAG: YqhA family protein [Bacteroidales bacterium]|nr:YqhA family protein [Bacteroidales bacterium]
MKLYYKIVVALPIIFSQLIALIFIGIGIYNTCTGIMGIALGEMGTESAPGLKLLHALDLFLFGFLFIIFSLGFSQLFLPESKLSTVLDSITPNWLHVKNFTELKLILWETMLTYLVLMFVEQVFKSKGHYNWEMGLVPGSIFLISLSIFFIRKGEKETKNSK